MRARRLLLLLAGLATSAAAIEAGLRLAGVSHVVFVRPDAVRGTALRPLTEGWYSLEGRAYVAINSHGYRDRERQRAKPPGTYRMAVLGDSFVEARQVALDETWCAVLERLLRDDPRLSGRSVEVLNFGVSGYGTAQEWLTLKEDVLAFQPDHVLLGVFSGNDISDNVKALSHPLDPRPYFEVRGDDLVLDSSFLDSPAFLDRQGWLASLFYATQEHSRLLQVAYRARRAVRGASMSEAAEPVSPFNQPGLPHNVYREPVNEAWRLAWRVTERLVLAMYAECARNGIRFGVVTLSNPPQVSPDTTARIAYQEKLGVADLFYPDRRIAALGEQAGFPVVNLAPLLQAYADEHRVHLHGFDDAGLGTGHWNARAHRLAADLIAGAIQLP